MAGVLRRVRFRRLAVLANAAGASLHCFSPADYADISKKLEISEAARKITEAKLKEITFKEPFRGNGAQWLKGVLEKRLSDFKKPTKFYYAKYVYASCMGKSRTVLQLGHEQGVFLFYCSTANLTTNTYPPRSTLLATRLEGTNSTAAMTFYMIAWLDELLEFLNNQGVGDGRDIEAAREWVKLQESGFSSFNEAKIEKNVLEKWEALIHEYSGTHEKRSSEETKLQELLAGKIEETKLQELLAGKIKDVLEQLGHRNNLELKLLFVVDEAKGLLQDLGGTTHGGASNIPFLHLRRAAMKLSDATLLLVMGTSATRVELALAGEDDESRRARPADQSLLHPVCSVGKLDLLVDAAEVPPPAVRDWLEDPARWTRYGRSLWAQRYSGEKDIRKLLELVQLKLLNLPNVVDEKTGEELTELLCLDAHKCTPVMTSSLLAFTAGVDFVPGHYLAQEASACHMVPVAMISRDRRRLWTVAPLEPVLSAAAAALLQEPEVLKKALEHHLHAMQAGHTTMSKGDRAEMVLKSIVYTAMLECQKSAVERGKYMSCVPTLDFLKYLLGDECPLPEEPLANSFVFFNRILCVDDVPSQKDALEFFKRGVICAGSVDNTNRGVDMYIFVWFPKTRKLQLRAEAKAQAQAEAEAKAKAKVAGLKQKPKRKPKLTPQQKAEAKGEGEGEGKAEAEAKAVAEEKESLTEGNMSYVVVSAKRNELQSSAKLTADYVQVSVPSYLPYVALNFNCMGVPTGGKAMVQSQEEGNANEYMFSFTGIPKALSSGRFSGCTEVLEELSTVDPLAAAAPEDQASYKHVLPWGRKCLK